jgi:hypothetical protein
VPRYFFNVYDGLEALDHEGTELPDWDAARRAAIRLAGGILDDQAHRLGLGEIWHMDVTDSSGLVLFRLDFNVTTSPAIAPPCDGEKIS